jgi:[ribosomal protein S5]-alanine N-acetyltransferase
MVELRIDRIILRFWRDEDVLELVRIASNEKIARNMMTAFPFPYTLEDAVGWVEVANGEEKKGKNFAVEVEGKLAGGCGFDLKDGLYEGCASGGYWLGEDYWGRGIATEAWGMVRDYAFENFDIRRFEASAFSWNPASMRVQEKCGMKKEGVARDSVLRFGEVCDKVLYGMTRTDWERLG